MKANGHPLWGAEADTNSALRVPAQRLEATK
jgi:hypothetical protein